MPFVSRRRFLVTLTAGAAFPRLVQAASDSPTVEILVDDGGWGKASPKEVRAVLVSTAGAIWPYCAGERLKPIRVYRRGDYPQTDFIHDWRGRVRIGLNTSDGRWAQMAFQFGHEFCHALAQHSAIALRGWHPPKHANLWFEESLCEASSLFVLRRLAVTWQQHPPNESWRSYAPAMAKYAEDRLALSEHQLPASTTFPAWFRQNEPALRENAALREKNVIIARQLLPLLEAEPAGWDAVCYLNLGAHQPGKPFAQHLSEWQTNSPATVRPFVSKIAALFPTSVQAPNAPS
jgi:hypothetical protein